MSEKLAGRNSKWKSFLLICFPVLLAAGILTEAYLFPEFLAPDCIRIVTEEEETREELSIAESGMDAEKAESMHSEPEGDINCAYSVFRFYVSDYRIAWKFF